MVFRIVCIILAKKEETRSKGSRGGLFKKREISCTNWSKFEHVWLFCCLGKVVFALNCVKSRHSKETTWSECILPGAGSNLQRRPRFFDARAPERRSVILRLPRRLLHVLTSFFFHADFSNQIHQSISWYRSNRIQRRLEAGITFRNRTDTNQRTGKKVKRFLIDVDIVALQNQKRCFSN